MTKARLFAFAFLASYAASMTCLLLASYFTPQIKDYLGEDWTVFGGIDVALAFLTALLWIVLRREQQPGCENYEQAVLASATVVGLFFAGSWLTLDRADNTVLLGGLAWRSFVLC